LKQVDAWQLPPESITAIRVAATRYSAPKVPETTAEAYERAVKSIQFMEGYDKAGAAELRTAVGIPASTDDEKAAAVRKWREYRESSSVVIDFTAWRRDQERKAARRQRAPGSAPATGGYYAAAQGIPSTMTGAMRADLAALDFSADQISTMPPAAAHKYLSELFPPPPPPAPRKIQATPFVWVEPSQIRRRDWITVSTTSENSSA
jgi:hypothetical protein